MIDPEYEAFIRCWNDAQFFEAHEVLEGLWIRTRDEGQRGLIQLAAALHHVQRGNLKGAVTMIGRALPRLRGKGEPGPIDRSALADYAERLRTALTTGTADPAERPRL
jgi:uncharacterized protein